MTSDHMRMVYWRRRAFVALGFVTVLGLALSTCNGPDDAAPARVPTPAPTLQPDPPTTDVAFVTAPGQASWASTVGLDGNRSVDVSAGAADGFPVLPTQVSLDIQPVWVVSVPLEMGGVLHAVTDGVGGAAAVAVTYPGDDTEVVRVDPTLLGAAPMGRPALVVVDGQWAWLQLETQTNGEAPIVLPGGGYGWVDLTGVVHLGEATAEAIALPDARLAVSDDGRVAWLAEPTDRYGHGILGDDLEADRVVIADATTGAHLSTFTVEPAVLEGTGIIWADMDGDGVQDVVATLSDANSGSRIVVVVGEDGAVGGPPVGATGGWRHQIAVAPGPDGRAEVVEVVMPHAARTARWSAIEDLSLVATRSVDGVIASHTSGSRNLDQAVVVDLTGDGVADLVGPPATATGGLVVVARAVDATADDEDPSDSPAPDIAMVLTGDPVGSNVTATATRRGGVQVAGGTTTNKLLIWIW